MELTHTKRGRVRWYVAADDGKAICGGVPSYDDEAEARHAAVRSWHLLGVELQLAGLLAHESPAPAPFPNAPGGGSGAERWLKSSNRRPPPRSWPSSTPTRPEYVLEQTGETLDFTNADGAALNNEANAGYYSGLLAEVEGDVQNLLPSPTSSHLDDMVGLIGVERKDGETNQALWNRRADVLQQASLASDDAVERLALSVSGVAHYHYGRVNRTVGGVNTRIDQGLHREQPGAGGPVPWRECPAPRSVLPLRRC